MTDFVELPEQLQGLKYSNLLCGVIRGALEMVRAGVAPRPRRAAAACTGGGDGAAAAVPRCAAASAAPSHPSPLPTQLIAHQPRLCVCACQVNMDVECTFVRDVLQVGVGPEVLARAQRVQHGEGHAKAPPIPLAVL